MPQILPAFPVPDVLPTRSIEAMSEKPSPHNDPRHQGAMEAGPDGAPTTDPEIEQYFAPELEGLPDMPPIFGLADINIQPATGAGLSFGQLPNVTTIGSPSTSHDQSGPARNSQQPAPSTHHPSTGAQEPDLLNSTQDRQAHPRLNAEEVAGT